jgi:hypothetical protein
VLFVSHNMAAVENLCTRGIWIASGQVRLDGPTHDVIEAYMASFSSAENAGSELDTVEGRRGSGEIRYTRVEFLSPKREPQHVTRSGKGVIVRLHYRASEPIERPCFGIRVLSDLGTLVTDSSTWLHGIDIPLVPVGEGYVELEIDFLNLLPGRYFLTLWVDSVMTKKCFEVLENSIHLDIEEAPVYNYSRRVDNRYGLVYFPQRWNLEGIGHRARLEVSSAANG